MGGRCDKSDVIRVIEMSICVTGMNLKVPFNPPLFLDSNSANPAVC